MPGDIVPGGASVHAGAPGGPVPADGASLSPLANVGATRDVLQRFRLSTKKALGQHFLVSDGIVRHICQLAQVGEGDSILEIGPGIGTLTCALLASGARVAAVERDADLVPVLEHTCGAYLPDALRIVNLDALELGASNLPFAPAKLVANLPYAVAATLVLDVFQKLASVQSATVMVQQEVAQRMMARPGTKDYGAFTVKLALHAQPAGHFNVAPGNFFPPPRVNSTVIRLERCQTAREEDVVQAACIMADASFATRRKTIANSCRTYFAGCGMSCDAAGILEAAGIDPTRRGETLSVEEYVRLGEAALAKGLAC